MTLRQAQANARLLGYVIKHDHWDREYSFKPKGGTEDETYYTDDLQDCYDTMIAEAKRAKAQAS